MSDEPTSEHQRYSERHPEMGTDLIVCAVCGRVLDYNERTGYNEHSIQDQPNADHPAVPVKASELVDHNARCDFCNHDVPTSDIWTVPASDFPMPLIPTVSVGAWAACQECVDLIRRDRWSQLIARVLRETPSGMPGSVHKDWLKQAYRRLAVHITGEPFKDPARRTTRL